VPRQEASRFGLLKRATDGRITDFVEKPDDPQVQKKFVSRDDEERPFLGSMGIYLFKTNVLIDVLNNTTADDFGGEVIPHAIQTNTIFGFEFDGYWEDIGTIRSFFETNLALTRQDSPFNFHVRSSPIYTRPRFLPGAIIDGASLHNVLLADGCRIHKAKIRDSVIGLRSQIADGAVITSSFLLGADFYESITPTPDTIPLGIGPDCRIEGAILDKNVRLGPGVVIEPFPRGTEQDCDDWVVRDGIVVIPKNTAFPAGTYIGPE
jgi:glucose-1-phosphate adenylyltransferase